MMSKLPAHVYAVKDRHGRTRYRFRRKGWPSPYIKGEPGEAAFHRRYAEIIEAGPFEPVSAVSQAKAIPRSLDDLYQRYRRSPAWHDKKAHVQHTQALVYERFLNRVSASGKRYGERPVASVTVGWLDRIFGDMADRKGAANDLRKKLRVLLSYAEGLRWIASNPVAHTTAYKGGPGRHSWTEEEIAQYRATHPVGTMARLTMELALNTAARRGAVAGLTRDNIVRGRIEVAHAKGNNEASVPMLASTKAALDALPAAPIKHLVINEFGRPFTVNGLGNRFRKWCDEAGLPQCSIHGLRKALSRRVAEAGSTDAEGMAVTGHKKGATFAHYRAAANRKTLADAAMSNLASRFDEVVSNPPENDGESDACGK